MNILAAISGESLLWMVVTVLVAGLIYYLLDWAITAVAPPAQFAKVARIILILASVIFLINALLGVVGKPFIRW